MTEPVPPFDLYGRAAALRDLVVAGFAARNVDLPDRRYVGPGQTVAYDGEQLTVSFLNIRPGRPEQSTPYEPAGFMEQAGGYAVGLVRNTPVLSGDGTPPSTDAMEKSALQNMQDVATMWAVLLAIRDGGTWLDSSTPWSITEVRTEGPQGGVVATVGLLSVSMF